jgi:hypothetical protein
VYTALKETETRATDLLPYWKYPLINLFVPRQRKAAAAVALIRCGAGVGTGGRGYILLLPGLIRVQITRRVRAPPVSSPASTRRRPGKPRRS